MTLLFFVVAVATVAAHGEELVISCVCQVGNLQDNQVVLKDSFQVGPVVYNMTEMSTLVGFSKLMCVMQPGQAWCDYAKSGGKTELNLRHYNRNAYLFSPRSACPTTFQRRPLDQWDQEPELQEHERGMFYFLIHPRACDGGAEIRPTFILTFPSVGAKYTWLGQRYSSPMPAANAFEEMEKLFQEGSMYIEPDQRLERSRTFLFPTGAAKRSLLDRYLWAVVVSLLVLAVTALLYFNRTPTTLVSPQQKKSKKKRKLLPPPPPYEEEEDAPPAYYEKHQ